MALRKSIIRRFIAVYVCVVFAFACAVGLMVKKMTVEKQFWMDLAEKKEGGTAGETKTRDIKPERGNILSIDGGLVTATIPYYNVFMDMHIEPLTKNGGKFYKENIDSLSLCLSRLFKDKSRYEYRRILDRGYAKGETRLRLGSRKVSYLELLEMKTFPILREGRYGGGIYYEDAPIRENLYGSLASRTIGNINREGRGIYGLESYYDSLLAGHPGQAVGIRCGTKWIYVPEKKAERGVDVVTTLDLEMQEICEVALRHKMQEVKAKNACIVVMEVATGEIKAMVNLMKTRDGKYVEGWNMAVADMSEPGSTFKTMSMMIALDDQVCDTSDIYDIHNGQLEFYDKTMRDHNWYRGGYDKLSVSQIMANSSNVGVSEIIFDYYKGNPKKYVDAILDTKFAENINIPIPGAAIPNIPYPGDPGWSGVSLPWMSIGYETQIPPIYTLNFYNAIANGGKMMRPYLVKEVRRGNNILESYSPEVVNAHICKESTVKKLQGMLEGVVEFGTAKSIKSDIFKIAGKTGTAQLNYGKGQRVHHQVSFCGYFPAENPQYSCIVVVKEPETPPLAAFICGEVFKKSAERIYAQKVQVKLCKKESDSLSIENYPKVKSGKKEYVEGAMAKTGLYFMGNASDWIAMTKDDMGFVGKGRKMLDNIVPNVLDMGLTDAIYLLEQRGLRVKIDGKGRVVKQSIVPGENIVKGSTIALTLR